MSASQQQSQSQSASITNKPDGIQKTKIEQKFAFWYRIADDSLLQPKHRLEQNEYETQVKKIAEFETIEDFWAIFQHLRKPDSCKPGIEFQLFKDPVKPMWEDENNKQGGKINIKLRKDYTTIIWEEMIFALIGGVLPQGVKENVNGVVVSSREEYNVLQIWFKNYTTNLVTELEQCIRDLLQIPEEVTLNTKPFLRSAKDFGPKMRAANDTKKPSIKVTNITNNNNTASNNKSNKSNK